MTRSHPATETDQTEGTEIHPKTDAKDPQNPCATEQSDFFSNLLGRMPGPFGTSGLTLRNRSDASPHSLFAPTRPHPIKLSPLVLEEKG